MRVCLVRFDGFSDLSMIFFLVQLLYDKSFLHSVESSTVLGKRPWHLTIP